MKVISTEISPMTFSHADRVVHQEVRPMRSLKISVLKRWFDQTFLTFSHLAPQICSGRFRRSWILAKMASFQGRAFCGGKFCKGSVTWFNLKDVRSPAASDTQSL